MNEDPPTEVLDYERGWLDGREHALRSIDHLRRKASHPISEDTLADAFRVVSDLKLPGARRRGRFVLLLSCSITIGQPSTISGEADVPYPSTILRALATTCHDLAPGTTSVEFLTGQEKRPLIRGGPFDVALIAALEGIYLRPGPLSVRGSYNGYAWPGMPCFLPCTHSITLICETDP